MNLSQYVGKVVRTRALDGGAWRSWACIAAVGHSLRLCPFGDLGGLEEPVEEPVADNCGEPLAEVEAVGEMTEEDRRFVGLLDATMVLPPGKWEGRLSVTVPSAGEVRITARAWVVIRCFKPGTRLEDVRAELDHLVEAEGAVNADRFAGQRPGWLLVGPLELLKTPAGGYGILCRLAQRRSRAGWGGPIELGDGREVKMVQRPVSLREMLGRPVRLRAWGFEQPGSPGPTEGGK